jgi:hypothetical protein
VSPSQLSIFPSARGTRDQGNSLPPASCYTTSSAKDYLAWLDALGEPALSAEEKLVLVFVREVGAVDNATCCDLTGVQTLRASAGLRHVCELELLEKKGQSTATYYVPRGRPGACRVPRQ